MTFEESGLGCEKEVSFTRNENCDTCGGTGARPGAVETTCVVCNGTGYIVESINGVTMV